MVGLGYVELFPVYWILVFEMNFMFVVLGQVQVIFVQANGFLMLEQDVDVLLSEFVWNL
jgi:hypothetical protein